jgi:alpha-tubulin suppressor-like RCC1 family protein
MARKTVFITTTGAGTFTVPPDFASFVSVEAIGGGGGARLGANSGGSGGGAYSRSTTITGLAAGTLVYCNVGAGGTSAATPGNGGDSWFSLINAAPAASASGANGILAKGGTAATSSTGAAGGVSTSGAGDVRNSGGNGGNASSGTGGGGGAGGPGGIGGNAAAGTVTAGGGGGGGANLTNPGGNASGGTGGNGGGGTGGGSQGTSGGAGTAGTGGGGGGATSTFGGNGGTGSYWTQTSDGAKAGSGGGGGGADGGATTDGGAGANYGGGSSGSPDDPRDGGQGIIVFTYDTDGKSNYRKDDPVFGTIDLDDQYVTDSWLVDKYVGGTLFAWGENNFGQLGNGNRTYYSSPVQVGTLTNWKQISAAQNVSIAVKNDGTLWAWGNNAIGQLGNNNTTFYSSPIQIGALTTWKQVSSGFDAILVNNGLQVAAITTSGALWMWGSNLVGQLGINATGTRYYSSPVQVGALTNWKQVSCEHNCAHVLSVKTDGTLWAWGANQFGQLGINTVGTQYYSSPVQVGTLTNWKQVSNGQWTSFAIKTDGTLWAWGFNASDGALGLGFSGNSSYYSSPVQVGALTNWKQVSGGLYYSSAIKTDGTLWAWGENTYGQLGNGNRSFYSSPVQIGSLTNWKYVSSGFQHTLAIKTDGTLWTWGANNSGQLGTGNISYYSSPVQIGSLTNWKYAGAGVSFSSAITFTDLT